MASYVCTLLAGYIRKCVSSEKVVYIETRWSGTFSTQCGNIIWICFVSGVVFMGFSTSGDAGAVEHTLLLCVTKCDEIPYTNNILKINWILTHQYVSVGGYFYWCGILYFYCIYDYFILAAPNFFWWCYHKNIYFLLLNLFYIIYFTIKSFRGCYYNLQTLIQINHATI